MMTMIHAFAGEAGDNSFDTDTGSSHFIVAAVLIRSDHLAATERAVAAAGREYFPDGIITPGTTTDNRLQRTAVLNRLLEADFSIYAIVVDKRALWGEGFRYKKSFYKFLNNLVYQELYKMFPRLEITIAGPGPASFLPEFKRYVLRLHEPDLFGGGDFGFSDVRHDGCVQLSAYIADTLAMCYDERLPAGERTGYLELLRPKITTISPFPRALPEVRKDNHLTDPNYNETVARMGIRSAQYFIAQKKIADQAGIDQVNCVKLLLLHLTTYGTQRYLTAKELIRHLNSSRPEPMKVRRFQTKVIAPLRDAGVLVVSSASGEKTGYKLPSSLEDLHKFVSHGNSMILPMLSRIKLFQETVKSASLNKIDILDAPGFETLRQLVGII